MNLRAGYLWRLLSPLVQDVIGGVASTQPAHVPGLTPRLAAPRPVLRFVPSQWPPEPGHYDEAGLVTGPGGLLADLGTAFTFEEVRAFLIGLCLHQEPSEAAASRISDMVNALVQVIARHSHRNKRDYLAAWEFLFGGRCTQHEVIAQTDGVASVEVKICDATPSGVYLADGFIGITGMQLAGSLRIAGTFCRDGALSLIKSDRLLAQYSPGLGGVSATFTALENSIGLRISGISGVQLHWDCLIPVHAPKIRGERR